MSMTSTSSVVDASGYTVSRTVDIAAPLRKVWEAVTVAEHLAKWFPNRARIGEAVVGASGTFEWDGYGAFPVRIEELDEPRMIAYRWNNVGATELDEEQSTVFRFTLEEIDGGTRLTVVETGFDSLPDPTASMEENRGGWNSELDELVAYLESTSA